MSSTRHAQPGTPYRQERAASSYQRGLLANLVAKRCEGLSVERAAPIWFLQWLSWQPGGLAAHLREVFPEEFKRKIHEDDVSLLESGLFEMCLGDYEDEADWEADCFARPECDPYYRNAANYRSRWIQNRAQGVVTGIGRRVKDAIEYARANRCLVLVDGVPRIGKSFAARECCEASAGMLRYVQVPASNDDMSFFRAIASALGVASSLKYKALEIRARVEETLQGSQLGIVFDEAHYLFTSNLRPTSLPTRINWIMTGLVNNDIPVVLITTPQFYQQQARIEKSIGWTSEQFVGRVAHCERLPDHLDMKDLTAVAEAVFPEGDANCTRILAVYADSSRKHLAAIESLVTRARWLAQKAGRAKATASDLRATMRESQMPSESQVVKSLAANRPTSRKALAPVAPTLRGTGADLTRASDEMISVGRRDSRSLTPD